VLEAVYVPLETPLLAACRERGMATVDGLGMLVGQGARSFALWTGVEPDRGEMRRALGLD
jgi:shikimate dehydrogenase